MDGLLRVNDYLYLTSPFPQIGDAMTITGILRFGNNNSKLEPRNEADIIRELALKEIGPGPVYVEEGAMNADTSPLLNVTLNAPAPAGGIVVALQSGAPERLAVPASVTVPEGQTQVAVKVDGLIGSVTAVVVSASYNGVTKTADVYVVPVGQNPKPISITPSPAYAVLGETVVVTMTLDIPAKTGGFVVTLDYDETIITGPTQAVFPAGTSQLELVFQGVGVGLTTIVGDGAGSFVSSEVWVVDLPQVGLVLSEVFYDPSGNDEGLEWVEIYNGTNDPIDLSNYSLGSGGASWIITVFQLSGTIPAGGCIVVGGPTSNASNFTPTFHQALDFNPDVQNSGDTADGVGLFNVKATSLTAGSIPIDAVLYGPVNTTGLKDETGSAGAVDVGDAISAQSVERKGTGWQIQATPTPNNCAAVLSL